MASNLVKAPTITNVNPVTTTPTVREFLTSPGPFWTWRIKVNVYLRINEFILKMT
jgi:hypothetical protein